MSLGLGNGVNSPRSPAAGAAFQTTTLVVFLDQLQTPIMVIITQDREELTKLTTTVLPDDHEDLGQSLVREVGWEGRDCFDEGKQPWS